MANKTLLERLQMDAKRHRAPQTEILPAWVSGVQKNSSFAEPVVITLQPKIEKNLEKSKKAAKKVKKKKK